MRASSAGRFFAVTALSAGTLLLAPAGCFFPDYTFDLTTASSGGSGGTGSTTTTSSTSSTSTSSTSDTGGTGGMAHVMEDCLNGVDDNGDGKIDCEDPDCQAYECVDEIPTGWGTAGYVAVYEGPSAQTPPDCPADLPTKVYEGNATLNAQLASCSPCGCDSPTGQDCELTQAASDLNPSVNGIQPLQVANKPCNNNATQINTLTVPNPPWGGACFHAESLPAGQTCVGSPCNSRVEAASASVQGGSCQPNGGVPTKPQVSWVVGALACRGTKMGGGCASPKVCLPKLASPYKPHVCVEKPGDVECPSGTPFSKKSVFYDDFDDTRDCTACSCASPTGGTCEITLSLYSDQAVGVCATPVASVKTNQCVNLTGNPGIYGWTGQVTKAPAGATCAPTAQSSATGNVTPKNATTFCCL